MGDITNYIDLTQILLYAFWIFFFFLVLHLHREGKREGWPLELDSGRKTGGVGGLPKPKTYKLAHGQGQRPRWGRNR